MIIICDVWIILFLVIYLSERSWLLWLPQEESRREDRERERKRERERGHFETTYCRVLFGVVILTISWLTYLTILSGNRELIFISMGNWKYSFLILFISDIFEIP